MANKNIFGSHRTYADKTDTFNEAGGTAYTLPAQQELAQLVVTGTLNGTFYASAEEQLEKIKTLAAECSDAFLGKLAVYGREVAKMKDTPALLLAILASRKTDRSNFWLQQAWSRVITNKKMLANFVQILRSGQTGRKSFGTLVRRLIREWLEGRKAEKLFKDSIGNDPSLVDIIKMVHPKAESQEKNALYGYLLGREYAHAKLPKLVKDFENYKKYIAGERKRAVAVPDVPFQMLTALSLGKAEWTAIALNASWNTLRMNLNTFQRHGVLDDSKIVEQLAAKLADREEVKKNSVFPYQLLTTYQNTVGQVPLELTLALQEAMEYATENVPSLNGGVAVCVDTSGSMQSAITGNRKGSTSKTKAVDIAALVAACMMRANRNCFVVPFDTNVHKDLTSLNPRDSIMTNARLLARSGGGTRCGVALGYINELKINRKVNTVVYVSDNQSWYVPDGTINYAWGRGAAVSEVVHEWKVFKNINPKGKLICIDVQPYGTVQAPESKDVLNIGGFSDNVFTVIERFVNHGDTNFVGEIEDYYDA